MALWRLWWLFCGVGQDFCRRSPAVSCRPHQIIGHRPLVLALGRRKRVLRVGVGQEGSFVQPERGGFEINGGPDGNNTIV